MFSQIEMFYLAQAICSQHAPIIQENLNNARRKVIEEINLGPTDVGGQVTPSRQTNFHRWSDFQITPEFSLDPFVTGKYISKGAITRLRQAHKEQVQAVINIVESTIKEGK
jgi:hypothetical protein